MKVLTDLEVALLKDRYNRLSNTPKNIKCPGVLRKITRMLRKAGEL